MNTNSVAPLRFVLTATVKEEYDAGQDGYDAIAKEPTLAKLSNENDQVGGLEGVYGYIINHRPRPASALTQVEGSEGFFSTLREGFDALVKMVKDFFQWLWSFASGKSAKTKSVAVSLEQKLKQKGMKDEEIPYGTGAYRIYPKDGKPDSNIAWMPGVMTHLGNEAERINRYSKLIEEYCKKVEHDLTSAGGKNHAAIREGFFKGSHDLLKPNDHGLVDFGRKGAFQYESKTGKLVAAPIPGSSMDRFKSATFRTSLHEVESLVTASLTLGKKIDGVLNNTATSETPIVQSLNRLLSSTKGSTPDEERQLRAGADVIKEVIRVGFSNLQLLETSLVKAHSTAVNMIARCAKD